MAIDIVELNLRMTNRTDPQLIFNTRSGGVAINGSEQIISPLSSRWKFSAEFPIIDKAAARTIRAVKSRLKGRFNHLRLRICDQYRITRMDIDAAPVPDGVVTHSDGTLFSDGSGYALASPSSPIMATAAKGATEILVRASDFNEAMTSGVFFSIKYKLYQVDDWELDGSNYRVAISPPLRVAADIGDESDFDAVCDWRLASDEEGQLNLSLGKYGAVTLNLVEPL